MDNKKVVVFGGGTGLSYLLKGLQKFPLDITAVITVSDNGRSTGKLREEFHTPAVGDIRHVITALSDIDDPIKKMMEYRFKTDSDLNGHALGNLVLTAMLDITGSLKKSIHQLSKLLDVKATVLPISESRDITLVGEAEDGTIIEGEEQITKSPKKIVKLSYKDEPIVLPEVIKAVNKADLIILSMGSLFTSIIPNILPKEVTLALEDSKAPIMYVCNAVTQPGETDNFKVSDHLKMLNDYLGKRKVDAVIASNSKIDKKIAEKYYTAERKDPVPIDYEELEKMGVELLEDDLITIEDKMIRHNSLKLNFLIYSYLMNKCHTQQK